MREPRSVEPGFGSSSGIQKSTFDEATKLTVAWSIDGYGSANPRGITPTTVAADRPCPNVRPTTVGSPPNTRCHIP
jgi:hypothetical protein